MRVAHLDSRAVKIVGNVCTLGLSTQPLTSARQDAMGTGAAPARVLAPRYAREQHPLLRIWLALSLSQPKSFVL